MRALRICLVLLVVLGGLAVLADRLAVGMAENEVAGKVRSSMELGEEPGVSIHGFPFLTQLVGKEFDRIDLELESYQVRLDDDSVTVRDLEIQLSDVQLSNGYSDVVARSAEGDGMISYEEMATITGDSGGTFGVAFAHAEGGQVEVRVTAMGKEIGPSMIGELTADGDLVRLDVEEIPSFSDIPGIGGIDAVEEQIRQLLDRERQITGLPAGVELAGLEPTEDGVRLNVTGTDVRLAGSE